MPCRKENSLLREKSNASSQESQAQAALRPCTHLLGFVEVTHTLPHRWEQLWGQNKGHPMLSLPEDLELPHPVPMPSLSPTGVFSFVLFKEMLPGQTWICNEVLELCGGNRIKLVRDVKDRNGMTSDWFHTWQSDGWAQAGLATQGRSKCSATTKKAKGDLSMLIPRTNIF